MTKEDYDAAIAASTEKPLIIDFTATWCPPCKMIGPIFEGYMEKTKGKLTLKKLDVDANSKASQAAGISAMPTFKVYKDGAEVEKLQGADPNKLKEMVERFGNLSLDGDADDDEPAAGAEDTDLASMADGLSDQLFMTIANKVKNFTLGPMKSLSKEVRNSLTSAVANFLGASSDIEELDVSKFVSRSVEAGKLADSITQAQRQNLTQIRIVNKSVASNSAVMGKVTDLVKGSQKLKSLDLSKTSASGEQVTALL